MKSKNSKTEQEQSVRYDTAEQLIRLSIWIRSQLSGVTINNIAQYLGKQKRTAERVKDFLESTYCGSFEVIRTEGRTNYWGFLKNAELPLIQIKNDELLDLQLAKKSFLSSGNELQAKSMEEIITKIKAVKNNLSAQKIIEPLMEIEGLAVRQYPRVKIDTETFSTIRDCITDNWKLKFDYPVKDEVKQGITVNSYGILYSQKTYLVAYNEYVKDYRLYDISKIQNIKKIYEKFEVDPNFNLQEYSNKSFGIYQEKPFDVVLNFNPQVKNEVKNYFFHPTQELIENEDGSTTVKFSAGGSQAILWELFKWGTDVTILAPQELRDMYKEKLSEILERM